MCNFELNSYHSAQVSGEESRRARTEEWSLLANARRCPLPRGRLESHRRGLGEGEISLNDEEVIGLDQVVSGRQRAAVVDSRSGHGADAGEGAAGVDGHAARDAIEPSTISVPPLTVVAPV